ncbi:MAG: diacylglycerol kinase [Cytophagaceae bacterium SCN 52-12]|nr:MAG: diacylglycerol kinase [Cytophagaceae bacterium SCN 52-12]
MKLSLIVAANTDGVIGGNNGLLWHLPEDLKRFKRLTMGKPILMGRKTFESIGKPLPGRTSFVITRNHKFHAEGIVTCASLEDAVEKARGTGAEEAFVIGGGEIYVQTLPLADRIYLTRVYGQTEGDTYFHIPEEDQWETVRREFNSKDDRHAYDFEFLDLVRSR